MEEPCKIFLLPNSFGIPSRWDFSPDANTEFVAEATASREMRGKRGRGPQTMAPALRQLLCHVRIDPPIPFHRHRIETSLSADKSISICEHLQ